MQNIIDKIMDLREEYYTMEGVVDHSSYVDGSEDSSQIELNPMSYPELLRIRKDLSCLTLELAVEVAKHVRDYERGEGQRRTAYARSKNEAMGAPKRMNGTKADSYAEEATAEQREMSSLNKGLYQSGKFILNQANEVLKSLNQDISIIRKEYETISK